MGGETPRPGDLIAQVHRRTFDVEILEDEMHHSEKVSAQMSFNPKTGEFEVFVHETCETYRLTTHTKISVEETHIVISEVLPNGEIRPVQLIIDTEQTEEVVSTMQRDVESYFLRAKGKIAAIDSAQADSIDEPKVCLCEGCSEVCVCEEQPCL